VSKAGENKGGEITCQGDRRGHEGSRIGGAGHHSRGALVPVEVSAKGKRSRRSSFSVFCRTWRARSA
jgi:hypothetical protein